MCLCLWRTSRATLIAATMFLVLLSVRSFGLCCVVSVITTKHIVTAKKFLISHSTNELVSPASSADVLRQASAYSGWPNTHRGCLKEISAVFFWCWKQSQCTVCESVGKLAHHRGVLIKMTPKCLLACLPPWLPAASWLRKTPINDQLFFRFCKVMQHTC